MYGDSVGCGAKGGGKTEETAWEGKGSHEKEVGARGEGPAQSAAGAARGAGGPHARRSRASERQRNGATGAV